MKLEKKEGKEPSAATSVETEGHKDDMETGDAEAGKSKEVDQKENDGGEDGEAPIIPAKTSSTILPAESKSSGGLLTTSTTMPGAFAINNPLSDDPIIESLQRDQSLGDFVPSAPVTMQPQDSRTTGISAEPIFIAVADPIDDFGIDENSKHSNRSNRAAQGHKRRVQFFVAAAISVLVVLVVVLSIVLSRQRVEETSSVESLSRRREDMIKFLAVLTDPDAFDPSHPNASADRIAALQWIVEEDELQLAIPTNSSLDNPAATKLLERYVMALFYLSTNGEQWTNQFNFLSRFDVCRWSSAFFDKDFFVGDVENDVANAKGAVCDDNERVNGIRLWWENLSGTLPEELGFLDLFDLVLSGGSIGGTVPSFLADFPNITTIGLSDHCLTGTLPEGMSDIPTLSVLSLYNNKHAITGSWEPFCETPTSFREGVVAVMADYGVECSCCSLCDPVRFFCVDPVYNGTWSTISINDVTSFDSRNNAVQFQKDCLSPAQLEWIDEECPCLAVTGPGWDGEDYNICDDCTSEGSRRSIGN
mmetsp:Transcript_22675/g.56150  ORF Transcript_22675/g.56150 Transcript_22675/m.56150 type:complete len:533 (+) Transcript_22675:146-1744(+)